MNYNIRKNYQEKFINQLEGQIAYQPNTMFKTVLLSLFHMQHTSNVRNIYDALNFIGTYVHIGVMGSQPLKNEKVS